MRLFGVSIVFAAIACATPAAREADTSAATPSASAAVEARDSVPPRSSGGEREAATTAGATSPSGGTDAARTRTAPVQRVSRVGLERGACFGKCPVYRLTIDDNGTVQFDGQANVAHAGGASGTISSGSFADLAAAIVAARLESLASNYTMGSKACGQYATDLPTVVLTATIDGRTHVVRQDYGCRAAPPVLRGLHRMIDSVANVRQWTGQ